MGELPGPVTETLRLSGKPDPARRPAALAHRYYTALLNGDLGSLEVLTDRYHQDVNAVFEISHDELEWRVKSPASYGLSGVWSLEYKRELSTPLRVAAGRGHAGCACAGGHDACAALLLEHGADPQLRSQDGRAPLHFCTAPGSLGCARLLLQHGAAVGPAAEDTGDTPLHVAARHGLREHAELYLARGAAVDARNAQEETPLGVLCGQAPSDQEGCLQLCRLLLRHGAHVEARDEARRRPLHRACGQANHQLAHCLLRRGADVNALDYDGLSPLGCALRAAACKRELWPHLCVQLLLNHGAQKIWPGAFAKVLESCAAVPEIIEILFNSYSQIPVLETWAKAVPEEVFQQHATFYESFFGLAGRVRCLQHLCRSAIRKVLGSKCQRLVPLLPVPKALHSYLLLEPQGMVL
ncbi:ASB18 protein, partial [Crypturellus undulatus]|nr:ASB18 protein [Crypturellus undulatus]